MAERHRTSGRINSARSLAAGKGKRAVAAKLPSDSSRRTFINRELIFGSAEF
jgi:hypothetical protein